MIQRSPYGLEQQSINQLWMELHPAMGLMRQCKHHVAIRYRQDVGAMSLGPLLYHAPLTLRTVPITATEVLNLVMLALIAVQLATTHGQGTAWNPLLLDKIRLPATLPPEPQ